MLAAILVDQGVVCPRKPKPRRLGLTGGLVSMTFSGLPPGPPSFGVPPAPPPAGAASIGAASILMIYDPGTDDVTKRLVTYAMLGDIARRREQLR